MRCLEDSSSIIGGNEVHQKKRECVIGMPDNEERVTASRFLFRS